MFSKVKHWLQVIFSLNLVVISIIVGLLIYFIDLPNLKKSGFIKDAKIAKCMFIIYLIAPTLIYIILKFI